MMPSGQIRTVIEFSFLSFLVTTPGWEPSLGGFPALSAMPGQFLLKDVVLLGVALSSAGVALSWRPPLKVQFTTTRDDGYRPDCCRVEE